MDTDGLFARFSRLLARAKPSIREDAGRLHVVNDGKMVYSDPDGDNCSWAIATSTEVEYVSTILNPCGIDQKPCTQWNRNMIQISHTGQLYLDIISENELDFETASALITVIEITDPNGLYARGTVEVDIVDVNEAPLFDEKILKSFFVIEESTIGTTVRITLSVMTSDPEAGDIFYTFDCLSNESIACQGKRRTRNGNVFSLKITTSSTQIKRFNFQY